MLSDFLRFRKYLRVLPFVNVATFLISNKAVKQLPNIRRLVMCAIHIISLCYLTNTFLNVNLFVNKRAE
jgi:hypothetical protein